MAKDETTRIMKIDGGEQYDNFQKYHLTGKGEVTAEGIWGMDMVSQERPQSKKNKETAKQAVMPKMVEEPITVDVAFNVLDRIIGFINNCDNKASIVLAGTVTVLAIIFSSEGIKKTVYIVSSILYPQSANPSAGEMIYLIFLLLSMALLVVGLILLILVIVARIKTSGSSIIYFGQISQLKDTSAYKERILSCSQDGLLTDILNQIYINSTICNRKYRYYNRGLRCTMIGFAALIIALAIGVFGY
jgi:hypothetical protein